MPPWAVAARKKPPELQQSARSPHPQPLAKIGEGALGPATGQAATGKHSAGLLEDKLGWFWQKPTSAALSEERVSFCGSSQHKWLRDRNKIGEGAM